MSATDHLPIDLLSAHLDGETTAEDRARVETHLAACGACRATFEDLGRLAAASVALGAPELPEGLRERIAASLVRPAQWRRRWLGAAASIAAVGLVATAWYLQAPPPRVVDAPRLSELGKAETPAPKDAARPAAPPPAAVESDAQRERTNFRQEAVGGVEGGVVGGVGGGVFRHDEAKVEAKMPEISAPTRAAVGAVACATTASIEAVFGAEEVGEALFDAVRSMGGEVRPGAGEVRFALVAPRSRWAELRTLLEREGVRVGAVEEPDVAAACVEIRLRPEAR